MEGVLVGVKRSGSTITISVVSDQQGRYRFPRNKLEPGRYTFRIRAVGYDLDDPGPVEVSSQKTTTVDLKLRETQDIAPQLSDTEWIMSFPGTEQQKNMTGECNSCHSLERVARSRHTAEQWMPVLARMGTYAPASSPFVAVIDPARRGRTPDLERDRRRADYLATINLSSGPTWKYEFKTLPRPKGKATRVIYTQYDLPRRNAAPHDVILDRQGTAWYADFALPYLGKLNPRTGEVHEYVLEELKPGHPPGSLDLSLDRNGHIWVARLMQGGIARFDPKTEKIISWRVPKEYNNDAVRTSMGTADHMHVDGKVWFNNASTNRIIHRLDVQSGEIETFDPYKDIQKGSPEGERRHSIYGVESDSMNNLYFFDFAGWYVGRIDAKTGKVNLYTTPTPGVTRPRRGNMDSQGRLWFTQYGVNQVAMFDPKTEQFREWELPTPNTRPYDVTLDKNGHAWTGGYFSDRIVRLNTGTGEFTEYLLPTVHTNIRRVFVDNSATPATFWVGNNHGAEVIKLEPLE